jgi:hypothetical protein
MTPAFDEITPHPDGVGTDDLLPIHERAYIVRAYRRGLDTMILRGAVRDQKPPLVIEKVDVALEVHPHTACPRIEENYQGLLGLSIARGFINTVRQMFGGPRGCTHTTALLQAMAPVAIQSMWSFRMAQAAADGVEGNAFSTPEGREQGITMNLNTCHVWAEDGEQVASIRAGEPHEVPVWMTKRLEQLGIDPTRPF